MTEGTARASARVALRANTYSLAAIFLALSFLFSLAFLAVRNTYDDEYSNLTYVGLTVPQVIHRANSGDVHPPGMYLLTKFAWEAVPSPRWMTIFTLLLLDAGLATYLFTMAPLFPSTGSRVCFLLLAALHPQLLMWGNTIRWYGWWTGVALITLVIALQPGRPARATSGPVKLGYGRAVVVGLLLTGLFYLNYITLVFGVALGATLLFRYSWRAWKRYLVVLAVFCPLIFPQVHYFLTVHIPGGKGQRSSFVLSLARLVEATLCSEAYLPWHPLAIVALVVFVGLIVVGVRLVLRLVRSERGTVIIAEHEGLAGVVLFSLLFFLLVALAGFGVKPRNGLLLIPTLAVPFGLIVGTLRPRVQVAVLLLLALWSGVGISHLLRREGLTKSNMNNRPDELIAMIKKKAGPNCSVVVTYDSLMALTVSTSRLPRTLLLSSTPIVIPAQGPPFSPGECPAIDLYRVKSYLGGMGPWGQRMSQEMDGVSEAPIGPAHTLKLSFDPDAARKRKLTFVSGASDLPDYRYMVTVTRIAPAELAAVERSLPDFSFGNGNFTASPAAGTTAKPRASEQ